ncbi:MAG: hypothetical protein QOJ41_761, partial [Acidobacteriaceae bacterium]|nr:hypothetical protein [Acidobacteriaceae bacterium]
MRVIYPTAFSTNARRFSSAK